MIKQGLQQAGALLLVTSCNDLNLNKSGLNMNRFVHS
jgi:hypothetical protein